MTSVQTAARVRAGDAPQPVAEDLVGASQAPPFRAALSCPFASSVNPHTDAVEIRTLTWARGHDLVPSAAVPALRRSSLGLLAGRTNPHLDADSLAEICDWYTWLAVFDQYCDRLDTVAAPARLGGDVVRFLRIMEEPRTRPTDPFTAALRDLCRRTSERATADQMRRLTLSVHGYFLGLLWEGMHRQAGAPVGLDDYRYMRRHTGGVPTWLVLIEIFGGTRPSPVELGQPRFVTLCERIGDVLTWQNDLVSYDVEIASGVPLLSLPTVLAAQYGWSQRQARDVAERMFAEQLEKYVRAERVVLRGAGPALAGYVHRLRDLVAGSLTWHLETDRYR